MGEHPLDFSSGLLEVFVGLKKGKVKFKFKVNVHLHINGKSNI